MFWLYKNRIFFLFLLASWCNTLGILFTLDSALSLLLAGTPTTENQTFRIVLVSMPTTERKIGVEALLAKIERLLFGFRAVVDVGDGANNGKKILMIRL